MALKFPSKRIQKTITIGCTNIFKYHVFEDGTTSEPITVKSYSYLPQSKKKQQPKKQIQSIEIEEEGEL